MAELKGKGVAINTKNIILSAPGNLVALAMLLVVLCVSVSSQAAEIIRDRGSIMSMPIQGVTLNMTPKQAFEHLTSNGFAVLNITRFRDWTRSGITFKKQGRMKPDGFPKWFIEISLGREDGRLVNVSESSQKLDKTTYHVATEIERVRRHFGISEEQPNCPSLKPGDVCRIVDGTEGKVVYSIQVRPTTKSTQLMIMK